MKRLILVVLALSLVGCASTSNNAANNSYCYDTMIYTGCVNLH